MESNKWLICYSSKYGATKEIAYNIFEELPDNKKLLNIKEIGENDFNLYDTIIIGFSVYIDTVPIRVTKFFQKFKKELMNKKLAIYVSCAMDEKILIERFGTEWIKQYMPKELVKNIIVSRWLGGRLIISTISNMDKMILVVGAKKFNITIKEFDTISKQRNKLFVDEVVDKIRKLKCTI